MKTQRASQHVQSEQSLKSRKSCIKLTGDLLIHKKNEAVRNLEESSSMDINKYVELYNSKI